MDKPLVSICSIAYNQESYIRDCLDGFMMQRTNFPFEVLIHDDASTDRTAEIIREYEKKYPDIIKPICQTENQHSKGVRIGAVFNYPRAQGKYIALCEGDDYWTDPLKLQKQVDFLEAHPEYSLCGHNSYRLYCQSGKKVPFSKAGDRDFSFSEILNSTNFATGTMVFRRDYLPGFDKFLDGCPIGDLPLKLYMANQGKVHYMHDIMSVYRVNSVGSWSKRMCDRSTRQRHYQRCHQWYIKLLNTIPQYTAAITDADQANQLRLLLTENNYEELSKYPWAYRKIRTLPAKQRLLAFSRVFYYRLVHKLSKK